MAGTGKGMAPGAKNKLFGPALAAFDADDDEKPSTRGDGAAFIGGGSALSDVPRAKRASAFSGLDLPAPKPVPKSALDDVVDLPAPVGPTPTGGGGFFDDVDLPAPVGPTSTKHGVSDLPAPVGPTSTKHGITDLPAPKRASGPAGIDDSGLDLPAPKGFFDDVPAPKATDAFPPAPSSRGGGLDLPAPKGFFDDVPAPKHPARGAPPPVPVADVPAPKGFFDDALDLPAPGPPPAAPAPSPGGGGFFDDVPVPGPAAPRARAGTGATGMLDLDDLDLEPSRMEPLPTAPSGAMDFGNAPAAAKPTVPATPFGLDDDALDLPGAGGGGAPSVPLELSDELGGPQPASSSDADDRFGGLELPDPAPAASPPPGAGAGIVSFSSAPRTREPSVAPPPRKKLGPPGAEADLELALGDGGPTPAVARVPVGPDTEPAEEIDAEAAAARKKKMRSVGIAAAVLVVVLGGGGLFFFQRYQEQQAVAERVDNGVRDARKALLADKRGHWQKAARAAEDVLEVAKSNDEATALAAQAYFAAALDEGVDAESRIKAGKEHALALKQRGAKGVEVTKAMGLQAVVERRPDEAVKLLTDASKKDGRDPNVFLYLGWAHALAGDNDSAAKAFERSLSLAPNRVPALYGRGLALLAMGKQSEAREAFLGVIEKDDQHIGAQIGMVELQKRDRFNTREREYVAITNRKDIDKADPRAVSRAWSLAGDEALRAGRADEALARYTRALEIDRDNLGAIVGEGKAALAQGRYSDARERLVLAIKINPNNVDALIAYAQAAMYSNDMPDALEKIQRALQLAPEDWQAHMVHGDVLRADPSSPPGAAEEAYRKAVKLAPEGVIAPTVALSKLLVAEGRGQDALTVLEPVEAAAAGDPALAVTLGVAYLGTGDAQRAESWFRKALEQRPNDVEAKLQLGLALAAQGRADDAIATLQDAYATEPREDIGVRLAQIYEDSGRDADAEKMYDSLLEQPRPSLNARARAGRFYARIGKPSKASAVGAAILAENPKHPAGHFLKGEGLYAEGKWLDAQKEYRDAALGDPRAQYYEAWGRAAEAQQLYDDALRAYGEAIKLDPKYVLPRLGRARIRVARREFQLAEDELKAAVVIAPDSWEIHFLMGESFYERDMDKEAALEYSASIKLDPSHAEVHYRLGLAYVDLDKGGPAMAAFRTATQKAAPDAKWLADAFFWYCYTSRSTTAFGECRDACRTFLAMAQPNDARERDVKKILLRCEAGRK